MPYLYKNTSRFRLIIVLSVCLICRVSQAQSANTLESIIVTADRQQSELRDTAASIFSVNSESLDTVSHVHINEALARVPGTWISRGNGQEHLTAIRSPVLTGPGSCGAFQMSQDGIPLRAAGFCNVNQLFEANSEQAYSIEVVRGPGSVLYGVNALHGAINIISEPVSRDASGNVSFEYGPHVYQRVKAGYSDSGVRHGFRVNTNFTSDNGYKDDSGFEQQKFTATHKYSTDNLSITSRLSGSVLNQETAGFIEGPEAYKDELLKRSNPNPEAFRDARSIRFSSNIEWQTYTGTLSITPYYRYIDMTFLQHFLPGTPLEENGHESFGVQTMFTRRYGDDLKLMTGVDLEFTDAFLKETQAGAPDTDSGFLLATLPVGKHYDFDVDAMLISPFAQIKYEINERNLFNLGIRYESLDYEYDNHMSTGRLRDDGTACGFGGCRYSRPADRTDNFDNFSVQAGWIHDFGDQQQGYANLSRAFRAPQANELYRLQNAQVVADLDSEELIGIEAGYRGRIDRISFNLSFYYMEKDNVIFQDSDRNNVSDGETEHKGIELNSAIDITENVKLTVAASYAKHTYTADIAPRGVVVNIEGNDVDTSPRLTGSTRLSWVISPTQSLEAEWIHMGSYFTDEANDNKYDGHELVNLRYQKVFMDKWTFAARITNLLDTDYAERADFAFGVDRYFVGEPRSLFVSAGFNF